MGNPNFRCGGGCKVLHQGVGGVFVVECDRDITATHYCGLRAVDRREVVEEGIFPHRRVAVVGDIACYEVTLIDRAGIQIGRASCRERGGRWMVYVRGRGSE